MALVQYSDSESDIEEKAPPKKLAKLSSGTSDSRQVSSLPPLPPTFHDLYASSTRVSVRDDPSLHGGRKRAIPHVEGNWPVHIYLEWHPSKEELAILSKVIAQIEPTLDTNKANVRSLLHSDLGAQLPLHISLSRPVVLRTEQRQSFMDTFQATLQGSDISAFNAFVDNLDCVSNFEQTRWFYVLRVKRPEKDHLNSVLRISNHSLALFDQPPLYETAANSTESCRGPRRSQLSKPASTRDYTDCFHISIAWSLLEPSLEEKKRIETMDLSGLSELSIRFDCVKVKIGNQISSLSLLS